MEADGALQPPVPHDEVVILPYITVQHDLQEVIQDVSDGTIGAEAFWVSVYRKDSPSVHGKVMVKASMESENQAELEPQGDFDFQRQTSSSFLVECTKLKVPTTSVKMPKQVLKSLVSKGIDSMDVSPNGSLYVVGGHDGALRVGNVRTDAAEDIRLLKGHIGDILSCKFFPSSEVVISTSSDLSARIFSALDGSNPRILQGHTAAVTDAAIIERGRRVLTTSNDGTLKLWLVAESKCLKTWRFGHGSRKRALNVAVFQKAESSEDGSTISDAEVTSKAAVVSLEDGTLAIVDLASSGGDPPVQTIQVSRSGKALTALAVTKLASCMLVASGSADGLVTLVSLDDTNLNKPAKISSRFRRNSADVTALVFGSSSEQREDADSTTLLVSSMDGLLYESEIKLQDTQSRVEVSTEYAGYDIDACNAVVQRNGELYAAGKDGHLRRY